MKLQWRYFTAALIPGIVLALGATRAYASYSEEWMSPLALQKEEATKSSHHTSMYACGNTGTHCTRIRSRTASAKQRAEIHDRDTGRADDPIAAFAKKGNASSSAHRS
ncbi:hypothetical protein WN982_13075 [Paraburkholderia sp. IMGN_8]|uniref:hypothetical protein n=1 Tax=Paraburkholderia sp. IMGN_8 TaxID=3136564 RepID=UPI0031012FE0